MRGDAGSPVSRVRLMVGTPCTQAGVTRQYLHAMLALQNRCAELGWGLSVETRADALVSRTRNVFASEVARNDAYTHLLMVDADIAFDPHVVERLVASGHDVVGTCVPLREVDWDRVRSALDVAEDLDAQQLRSVSHRLVVSFARQGRQRAVDGFLPVDLLGGAMVLVTRDALVALSQSDQVSRYERGGDWADWPSSGWTFFDPFIDASDGNYLSEDFAFFRRWQAFGGQVWADLHSAVTHSGTFTFAGDAALSVQVGRTLAERRGSRDD